MGLCSSRSLTVTDDTTSGMLYIYVIYRSIKVLVYAVYFPHDAVKCVSDAQNRWSYLLDQKPNWILGDLLRTFSKRYRYPMATAFADVTYTQYEMCATSHTVDLSTVVYIPKQHQTHCTYGDCYARIVNNKIERVPALEHIIVFGHHRIGRHG